MSQIEMTSGFRGVCLVRYLWWGMCSFKNYFIAMQNLFIFCYMPDTFAVFNISLFGINLFRNILFRNFRTLNLNSIVLTQNFYTEMCTNRKYICYILI